MQRASDPKQNAASNRIQYSLERKQRGGKYGKTD